jgi:AcrR family transcriptional regulator
MDASEPRLLRQRIVETALASVRERGLEALTMRALARQLGYSPASLYLHFRGKEELLREVAAEGLHALVGRAEPGFREDDPVASLRDVSRTLVGFAREFPDLDRLAFDDPAATGSDERASALRQRLFELVSSSLEAGLAHGSMRAPEGSVAPALLWMQLRGLARLAREGGSAAPEARAIAGLEAGELVEAGLALWLA